MNHWKEFFQNYRIVDIKGDIDLLYQVGYTVERKPISNEMFYFIIESIEKQLQLSASDTLLDLCCGNGVVTYELAKKVKSVIAVDFSKPYIENAKKFKNAENIEYFHGDVTDFRKITEVTGGKLYSKVLLYYAIAYIEPNDFENILLFLKKMITPDASIMLGSVLDNHRKWNYFNTIKRKLAYLIEYKLLDKDIGLGRWWTKTEIANISRKCEFSCLFADQDPILHTAHYRFDVILKKMEVKEEVLSS